MLFIYIFCGLFLGWTLGANDASNVFGTAVATRMISFRRAAWICSVFVILGCLFGGTGTTETLQSLGKLERLSDSALIVFAAALTILLMTGLRQPVSTSQAIVGGIVGWNIFSGLPVNHQVLIKIIVSWIASPVLSAIFTIIIYLLLKKILFNRPFHLFYRDVTVRYALIVTGALGAYSLGANNIANVMGVFVNAVHMENIRLFLFDFNTTHQLFLLGGLSISAGIFTYSKRVMMTLGNNIVHLLPEHALIVVLSHSIVLLIFSSSALSGFLTTHGLPAIPLVPVSSTQAIVGAIWGIGLIRSASSMNYRTIAEIALSWVLTPLLSALLTMVFLTI